MAAPKNQKHYISLAKVAKVDWVVDVAMQLL